MSQYKIAGIRMSSIKSALITLCALSALSFSSHAELRDQGLNSILQIIDKAIVEIVLQDPENAAEDAIFDPLRIENATAAVVNLSRTLGTLSYSRLQCGEAEVLAEFTQRVQKMPEQSRNSMRDAFQEGFDKSKFDTALLSDDECKRLTQSRSRLESEVEALVDVGEDKSPEEQAVGEEVVEEEAVDEPRLRHLRVAELSGQLAYKRKVCDGDKVFTRDYNAFVESVPEEYQEEVKATYWKGYKHGRRLNPNLTPDSC
jgi:predicted secreted protein